MLSLGTRIKNTRTAQRLSLDELASRTGISKGTLSMTERDITSLGCDNLVKICDVFGVSADFLLFGKRLEDKPLTESEPLKQLLLEVYASGNLATAFAAMQDLEMDQLDMIVQLAATMAEQNKKQGRAGGKKVEGKNS